MNVRDTVAGYVFADGTHPFAEGGVAALRVTTGVLVVALHGWHKVIQGWHYAQSGQDWPLLHETVRLGAPAPVLFAAAAAFSELVAAALLAAGALTRPAALLVAATMGTAVLFNLR